MISRWLVMTLAVVLWPGLLHAQPASNFYTPTHPEFPDVTNYDKMYEDIEIFRRILDRKLHALYPRAQAKNPFTSTAVTLNELARHSSTTATWAELGTGQVPLLILDAATPQPFNQWSSNTMASEVVLPSLEGVYLKGQGVIYTARLSSLQPAEKTDTSKPVSEWESVRRQLHNEKEEPKNPEAGKPPTLSDFLLKVLAENAHNFSQLGANESLTIVLTVHKAHPSSPARKSGGSAKTGSQAAKPAGHSNVLADTSDAELLGDLHQKQGHYAEAIKAFESAAAREPAPGPTEAMRLDRKMAQCYLALGEDEKARKALDHISALRKESTDAKDKPASAAKPSVALPTKLIISVPKKLLDEARGGKMSFEELRAKAHVEMLRFDENRAQK